MFKAKRVLLRNLDHQNFWQGHILNQMSQPCRIGNFKGKTEEQSYTTQDCFKLMLIGLTNLINLNLIKTSIILAKMKFSLIESRIHQN